jgi:hypothetical protein
MALADQSKGGQSVGQMEAVASCGVGGELD